MTIYIITCEQSQSSDNNVFWFSTYLHFKVSIEDDLALELGECRAVLDKPVKAKKRKKTSALHSQRSMQMSSLSYFLMASSRSFFQM